MKRYISYSLLVGTVLLLGCRPSPVQQTSSKEKPAMPVAEVGPADQLTNVNLPMPGTDGGPQLPDLPPLGENGQPQLPALPGLPGHEGGPQLPGILDLPALPDLKDKLPTLPELPQVPNPLDRNDSNSPAPSQEGSH